MVSFRHDKVLTVKLITRNTDYAIRAICCLAEHRGRIIAITELVKEIKVPRPFLRKLLQILGKAGIVKSSKGIGGGFELLRDPRKIYLVDIITIFQGSLCINECTFKKKVCPETNRCSLKKKIDKICRHVMSELKPITVGSLIKEKYPDV